MNRKLRRLICFVSICLVFGIGCLPQSASALDTPNTLMGIDSLVLRGAGLFRDPGSFPPANGNDGFNTFQFGAFEFQPPITTGYGIYDSYRFRKTDVGDCCISHNARVHSDTVETIDDPVNSPTTFRIVGDSITKNYLPLINRAAFGQRFDPDQYQIAVKFKPLLTLATATSLGTNPYPSNPTYPNIPASLENTANFMTVGLDSLGGYVWDVEAGIYKRANEQLIYNIGSDATPLNTWYVSAPHDADGFATYTVPVTSPSITQRGFYYGYGSGIVRDNNVNTLGGRVFNETTQVYDDVTYGFGPNYQQFGGGPVDPNNPNSKLNVPNGVPIIALGAPSATLGLSLEIKNIALTRITPTNLVARIDANSGLSFTFGTGFTYGATQTPINVPGAPTPYLPPVTDQISRFDANGMTNLILNMRTPDTPADQRFLIRGAPTPSTFDASEAVVNVRARLLQPLTDAGIAQTLRLVAKARKGNDTAAGTGADEWNYDLPLNLFNTSTMTTVSIALEDFTRNMMSSTLGAAPIGFANAGDGLLTNFGLYEFGGLIPANGGLLRMELEFMEMRLPVVGEPADYNDDGLVNAADYTEFRNHLGQTFQLDNEVAGITPGMVTSEDYDAWKARFGNGTLGSGGLAGSAVPEPATISLFAWLLAVAAMRRRTR